MSNDNYYLEELLAGISDGLTHQIHLFLVNTNLDDKQRAELIELINQAYIEGSHSVAPRWVKNTQSSMDARMDEFMKDFTSKLTTDGDKPERND